MGSPIVFPASQPLPPLFPWALRPPQAAAGAPEFSPSVLRPTKSSISRAEQVATTAAASTGAAADGRWKY